MADTCRSCGAPIVWGLTVKKRRMPLDADPQPDGTVVLVGGGGEHGEDLATVVPAEQRQNFPGQLRRPHHSTCPEGRAWQRSKKKP